MTSKWPKTQLGDVCQVIAGQSPDGQHYNDVGEGLPFYQGKKEFGFKFLGEPRVWTRQTTKSANAGDIVMSVRAPVGPVNIVSEKSCIGRGLAALQVKPELDRDFLYHFLDMSQDKLMSNEGTVFPSINKAQIEAIELPLPPLDEQKRIVAKLDETLADLDKVTANAKGSLEEIDALWSSYLSEVFYSTSNYTEKPTESTWTSEKLQNVCAFFNDGNWIESKDQSDEGYRLIQTGNIGEGIYKSNDHRARYVSKETFEKLKCTEVFPGDVLISRLPDPIGRACRVPEMLEPCITGVDCTILRFKDDVIPELFVYFSQTSNYLDAVKKMAGGTTRQRISRKNLGEIEFAIPPIEDQKQIITRLDAQQKLLEEMRNVKRKTLRDSEHLRSSILAAAFAGDF